MPDTHRGATNVHCELRHCPCVNEAVYAPALGTSPDTPTRILTFCTPSKSVAFCHDHLLWRNGEGASEECDVESERIV
jgi:hypothetical protein